MSCEVIQEHIKKEDLMNSPTQHADADQRHGSHRDATAQQYSPFSVQSKTSQNHHRIIFDRYENAQAQAGQQRHAFYVQVISQYAERRNEDVRMAEAQTREEGPPR